MNREHHIEWYKRNIRAELELALQLGPELKGALDILRDLYCLRGDLPNKDGFLAGNLGVSAQKMRAIKAALIKAGYLETFGDHLRCELASADYLDAATKIEKKRAAGRASAHARALARQQAKTDQSRVDRQPDTKRTTAGDSKISDLAQTDVATPSQRETGTETKKYNIEGSNYGEWRRVTDNSCDATSVGDALRRSKDNPTARALFS